MITRSKKRYCFSCQKKWCSRPRGRTQDYSFYIVALPLVLMFSFGMLKMTDYTPAPSAHSAGSLPAASMLLGKKGTDGLMSAIPPSMMKGDMKDKLEKLKKNPKLINKLSGEKKAMAEKALAMMKG